MLELHLDPAHCPKRILALDGGGIRGALTLGFLERMEDILRARYGNNPAFRLCDYFDLIGGTSTGAIIAGCLATGMSASEIKKHYLELGGEIFGSKTKWLGRLSAKFQTAPLEAKLKDFFGDTLFGDTEKIKTGLCVVTKRADTGSTWPIINHPNGKYYNDNRGMLLRKVIRASTAAPTYFKPELVNVGGEEVAAFVDGGVSMANNPSLQLFLTATLKGFPFHWETGEDKLLIISVGTGHGVDRFKPEEVTDNKLWDWASQIPGMLMNDATQLNSIMMQYISKCLNREIINREIGDMSSDLLGGKSVCSYARYNFLIDAEQLKLLGFLNADANDLREMDHSHNKEILAEIGMKAAARDVSEKHFPSAFDLKN